MLAFSDGLFAIAMTLLVVGISAPTLRLAADEDAMIRALGERIPDFVSFAVSFTVIGRYWVAHHRFFAMLRAVDTRLIGINLLYLLFIAFLPFPTELLGSYFDNAISVAVYALTVAIVSGLEVVMFRQAHRSGLLRRDMPGRVYRWGVLMSLLPVVFFALSVPVAFVSGGIAVAMWLLAIPSGLLAGRWRPAEADEYQF